MMATSNMHAAVEALILASPEPLPVARICEVVTELTPSKAAQAVAELNTRYADGNSSFRIRELAGGYQFYVLAEFTGYIEELFTRHRKLRLTQAALETLAIIAYKQPVTKAEVEHIRGVASDGVVHTLLERSMISITGRATTVGKPLQYGTTDEFLKFFGLASLEDLPKLAEIDDLMAASTAQSQTQLNLADPALAAKLLAKLNIADGTFDPASRTREDEQESSADDQITSDESEGNNERRSLVLQSGSHNDTFTIAETDEESDVVPEPISTAVSGTESI
ncbi:MAG: SMC-Scp complex subunit ScpB [candidate division Zixibacteria bacterium]|nr:SMC-Scp complex subunit ScpB [candidate division Zixibacteria bacterium]